MHTRQRLNHRLTYLWTFELLAAGLFTLLVILSWRRAELGLLTAVSLVLVVFMLVHGSLYWYAKRRAISRRPLLSDRAFVRLFRLCRLTSLVGLALGGLTLVAVLLRGTSRSDLWVGLGLWGLAALEFVNYYVRQLMYDTPAELRWLLRSGRLKVAPLRRDLAAGRL